MKKKELETLYNQYYPSLMAIACSYTHNRNDAQDLVQNTFVKAYLSYQSKGSFLHWCNKVLRNEFYNSVAKDKFLAKEEIDISQLPVVEDLLTTYIANEEKAKLASMISLLPMKYRNVMIDSVYLQLSDKEIADSRGLSQENVRQIRSRGKKLLLKMKEDEDEQGV